MNTDSGTWPVCCGAQHLIQVDVDDLLAKTSAHPVSPTRKMLDHIADTLC